jgi:hypothetical protein
VTIIGAAFTGATSVKFNGAPATFTVNTSAEITATVPPNATTGPTAVTTPAGTVTSAASFTLLAPDGGSGGGPCNLPLDFSGSQGSDCMRTIYKPGVWDRRAEISYGPDPGEQKLTTDCNASGCGNIAAPGYHSSARLVSNTASKTAWLAAYDPAPAGTALYGDGETCVESLDAQIDGEQCGGIAVLITPGSNQFSGSCGAADGGAYMFTACDAKGTDTQRLSRVNLCTGVITELAKTDLFGKIDTYGGTVPPANCDHNRAQADWHMYCQWVQVCLRLETVGNTIHLTGRSWLVGAGLKGDATRNDPNHPTRTLIGTTTYTGTRAANINATGLIGVAGSSLTGLQGTGITNLRITPP